jgi:two-component system, chemotaxis family, protein-glutamate methylesterase/glutaminase
MNTIKRILIGGSAGSLPQLSNLLLQSEGLLPPIVGAFHRTSEFYIESYLKSIPWVTPVNVDIPVKIKPNRIYVSGSQYHLLLEERGAIARLYDDDKFSYGKPSIDLLFCSCTGIEARSTLAILLSGANSDGAMGLKVLKLAGAKCCVMEPNECQFRNLTDTALKLTPNAVVINKNSSLKAMI